MYRKPTIEKYGTLRELTQNPTWLCSSLPFLPFCTPPQTSEDRS